MYVSFIMIKDRVFKHTYIIKSLLMRNLYVWISKQFKHVCMFHFHDRQRVFEQIHTRWRLDFTHKSESVCMYVCLRASNIHAWGLQTYIHTYTLEGFWDIHTCIHVWELKHTYIHTYTFAPYLGFQKYPPSQFKKKWTGMLQESLFQCVFEPYTFCENFETYIHTWGL